MNRTYDILDRLAQKLANFENDPSTSGIIVGIELLNEPFPQWLIGGLDQVRNYFMQ